VNVLRILTLLHGLALLLFSIVFFILLQITHSEMDEALPEEDLGLACGGFYTCGTISDIAAFAGGVCTVLFVVLTWRVKPAAASAAPDILDQPVDTGPPMRPVRRKLLLVTGSFAVLCSLLMIAALSVFFALADMPWYGHGFKVGRPECVLVMATSWVSVIFLAPRLLRLYRGGAAAA
jgi:hypothetical protein